MSATARIAGSAWGRVALLLLLVLPGCGGINLGGPGPDVPRDTGPLTVPPHMRDGAHQ